MIEDLIIKKDFYVYNPEDVKDEEARKNGIATYLLGYSEIRNCVRARKNLNLGGNQIAEIEVPAIPGLLIIVSEVWQSLSGQRKVADVSLEYVGNPDISDITKVFDQAGLRKVKKM